MKKIFLIFTFLIPFVLTGCYFDFFGLNSPAKIQTENREVSGNFRAQIINYKRHNQNSYTYKFKDLSTGGIITAKSVKYYYNSGDIADISVNKGDIVFMNLIRRRADISTTSSNSYDNSFQRIDTSKRNKMKKNTKIEVPKTQNITF